ncbi:hypothetical protein BJ912DRAFT_930935 [Pholiota molesta]|nr:hypothetical protein BJ912DRAFT_930935 [Pholiota molesta]
MPFLVLCLLEDSMLLPGLAWQASYRQEVSLDQFLIWFGLSNNGKARKHPWNSCHGIGCACIIEGLGPIIGRCVTAPELPQAAVALVHTIVGLSAVLTSIGSVLQAPREATSVGIEDMLGSTAGVGVRLAYSKKLRDGPCSNCLQMAAIYVCANAPIFIQAHDGIVIGKFHSRVVAIVHGVQVSGAVQQVDVGSIQTLQPFIKHLWNN